MNKKQGLNMPTWLTIIRIILVIPLMICLSVDTLGAKVAALVIFVLAAITDFLDGRIARKHKIETDLGRFLDPLADKMLVNLTFLMLVVMGIVPVWMFAIILVRDFAVDGMRMMMARSGETVAASKWGKSKTMTQMITLTLILLNLICLGDALAIINVILLYVVVILTIISGVDYLVKGWRKLSQKNTKQEN